MGAYGQWGFRDFYPGGVIHTMVFLLDGGAVYHVNRGQPGQLTGDADKLWRAAMSNPDLMMYPNIFNVIVEKGQTMPLVYDTVLNPYDPDDIVEKTETKNVADQDSLLHRLRLVRLHLQAAPAGRAAMVSGSPRRAEEAASSPGRRIWSGRFIPSTMRSCAGTTIGSRARTPASWTSRRSSYWVMGANQWRTGEDWPLPETQWTQALSRTAGSGCGPSLTCPSARKDGFRPTRSCRCRRRRPTSRAAALHDRSAAARIRSSSARSVLNLFAAIDQDDTNWIVVLKDVGPDVSVHTARRARAIFPQTCPERELTRGWLKASHRALDPERSKPWRPWHPLTRAAQKPVEPGKIEEYADRDLSTGNLFQSRPSHLPRHHQPRSAERTCRRARCRICAVSHLQQQDGGP